MRSTRRYRNLKTLFLANQHNNISRIRAVSYALEELNDSVVFVGGAVVSLYADRLAEEIRPTDDVDILIELANYRAYAAIEEKLRAKGFINDLASGVICRYSINGITVDVMPTSEEILGFSNRWYKLGYATAQIYDLGQNSVIKLFRPEYFLASKFDAFTGREKTTEEPAPILRILFTCLTTGSLSGRKSLKPMNR